MSAQLGIPGFEGRNRPENRPGVEAFRASIRRELRYLFTISANPRKAGQISPTGIAHSLGVCLLEDYAVARGKGTKTDENRAGSMPRFVDVKLSTDEREAFLAFSYTSAELIESLQAFADNGYRVGVAWSGETQSYTVSLTCRAVDSPNTGLCMTSFAGSLEKAVALAVFKHTVVTGGVWVSGGVGEREMFG